MNKTIEALLNDRGENHLMPFFWQHGEDEAVLRKYMGVIFEAGCGAVCVESRPHPDFCGPKWWADMDIILDEARKRDMKVWILDDSHFPTGFANGALKDAPAELCRQNIFMTSTIFTGTARCVVVDMNELRKPKPIPMNLMQQYITVELLRNVRVFDDDRILSVTAFAEDGRIVDLTGLAVNGTFEWNKPDGDWHVCVCGLSRNLGPHRNYINMMDTISCEKLIEAVYEPHYVRYKNDFGKTIAGFFSDEPELGNGVIYLQGNAIGSEQDLPWSAELENALKDTLGDRWLNLMPFMWDTAVVNRKEAARVRAAYMDVVTKLVRADFSERIGQWCRDRGVEYIGHQVEDNGQHCRTGSSLGHQFRALAGQDMAGIDNIGGQVLPQGEDEPATTMHGMMKRSGEFFHYGLGKLAVSSAAIEPRKRGRALCEIFGNYGWQEGVKLEKYLIDHFLVRGVNYYVPHAFSPKEYPDPDCPPHFYAHGHNPQYRHFSALMRYTNRICNLISGGKIITEAAILYHAEAEWAGQSMPFEKPLRALYDRQIDCCVIPIDVFADPETYRTDMTNGLIVNGNSYKILVIPYSEFLPTVFIKTVVKLYKTGFSVIFVDALPSGVYDGEDSLLDDLWDCPVVPLSDLAETVAKRIQPEIRLLPANNRIRVLHYRVQGDLYMIVNEAASLYQGTLTVPDIGICYTYNAWKNRLETVTTKRYGEGTAITLSINPLHNVIIIFDNEPPTALSSPVCPGGTPIKPEEWMRSLCKSIDYPHFGEAIPVTIPDTLAESEPAFSGFARYETNFTAKAGERMVLEITDALEGMEVFVNGTSAGLQITPPYLYDISLLVKTGGNELVIEVATTLERERKVDQTGIPHIPAYPETGSGITGKVVIWRQ
ncbi:MAG: hypothetical protein LBB61_03855 [Treponema sp.]|jgi:hypothetical protein|nr:hypothetical protein [Treponema sp.]